MFDFGLKPCPLCGGEPTVEHLAQGPEQLRAVIKCSACGLTLDWETEIKVGISRSGKRTTEKVGLDPIEAWNRRAPNCDACTYCKDCATRRELTELLTLPTCNDCGGASGCDYVPIIGRYTRINCPLWRPMEATP